MKKIKKNKKRRNNLSSYCQNEWKVYIKNEIKWEQQQTFAETYVVA